MKTKPIIWISFLSVLLILLVLVFVTINFMVHFEPSQNLGGVSILKQTTPTPIPSDHTEIGSTDGILVMGAIIVLIAMVPVILIRSTKK
jgi:hypothetical protein